jgi:hypothetical protein
MTLIAGKLMLADIVIRGVDLEWLYDRCEWILISLLFVVVSFLLGWVAGWHVGYDHGRDDEKAGAPSLAEQVGGVTG